MTSFVEFMGRQWQYHFILCIADGCVLLERLPLVIWMYGKQMKNVHYRVSSICKSLNILFHVSWNNCPFNHFASRTLHWELHFWSIQYWKPKSNEIVMSVCMQKDAKQCCDVTKLDCTLCSGGSQNNDPVKNLSSQLIHRNSHWNSRWNSFWGRSVTSQWTHEMTQAVSLLRAFREFATHTMSLL